MSRWVVKHKIDSKLEQEVIEADAVTFETGSAVFIDTSGFRQVVRAFGAGVWKDIRPETPPVKAPYA